jgi:hypothetical protein
MKRRIIAGLCAVVGALGVTSAAAPQAQAVDLSWCRENLRGAHPSQPVFVRDNDIGYIRKRIEDSYNVDIVEWNVTRMNLLWGDYGSASGALEVTVTYKRANGTGYTSLFYCEKHSGVFTDWPVNHDKWGVWNP